MSASTTKKTARSPVLEGMGPSLTSLWQAVMRSIRLPQTLWEKIEAWAHKKHLNQRGAA
jgi:hypothetical protein